MKLDAFNKMNATSEFWLIWPLVYSLVHRVSDQKKKNKKKIKLLCLSIW